MTRLMANGICIRNVIPFVIQNKDCNQLLKKKEKRRSKKKKKKKEERNVYLFIEGPVNRTGKKDEEERRRRRSSYKNVFKVKVKFKAMHKSTVMPSLKAKD